MKAKGPGVQSHPHTQVRHQPRLQTLGRVEEEEEDEEKKEEAAPAAFALRITHNSAGPRVLPEIPGLGRWKRNQGFKVIFSYIASSGPARVI